MIDATFARIHDFPASDEQIERDITQTVAIPRLFLTFMFGPGGLLLYLVVRNGFPRA